MQPSSLSYLVWRRLDSLVDVDRDEAVGKVVTLGEPPVLLLPEIRVHFKPCGSGFVRYKEGEWCSRPWESLVS